VTLPLVGLVMDSVMLSLVIVVTFTDAGGAGIVLPSAVLYVTLPPCSSADNVAVYCIPGSSPKNITALLDSKSTLHWTVAGLIQMVTFTQSVVTEPVVRFQ